MKTFRFFGTLLFIFSIVNSNAQEFDIDEFILKYRTAMKAVKSIEYEISAQAKEPNSLFNGEILGTILYKEGSTYKENKFLFLGERIVNGVKEEVSLSDNNERFFLYKGNSLVMNEESENIKVFDDFSQIIMNSGMGLSHQVFNGPFSSSPQYGYVSTDDEWNLLGFEDIHGIECAQIELIKAKSGSRQILHVGKEDHLLRRIEYNKLIADYRLINVDHNIKDEYFDLTNFYDYSVEKGGVIERGLPAPSFNLMNMVGEKVSLVDYRGKVLVIDFWGTWCKPCLEEIPELNEMYESLKVLGVEFIGISCFERGKVKNLEKTVHEKEIKYPVLVNGDVVSKDFKVTTFPTLVVIDERGKVLLTKGSGGESSDMSFSEIVSFIKSRM